MIQVFLFIVGVYGLFKRRIKISSKKELVGAPVVFLSIFYLVLAVIPVFIADSNDYFFYFEIGAFILVTLLVIIFSKGQPKLGAPSRN